MAVSSTKFQAQLIHSNNNNHNNFSTNRAMAVVPQTITDLNVTLSQFSATAVGKLAIWIRFADLEEVRNVQ